MYIAINMHFGIQVLVVKVFEEGGEGVMEVTTVVLVHHKPM